jgi:hypothetical protein
VCFEAEEAAAAKRELERETREAKEAERKARQEAAEAAAAAKEAEAAQRQLEVPACCVSWSHLRAFFSLTRWQTGGSCKAINYYHIWT